MRVISVPAVLLFSLVGCATNSAAIVRANRVAPGDSMTDVEKLLGPPGDRQFSEKHEAWQYCSTDLSGLDADRFRIVWFTEGRATGVSTYSSRAFGMCESNFRPIRWEERPDATIEVRAR